MRLLPLTLLLVAGTPWAQESAPEAASDPAPVPQPCSSAEHHQFDFWIGTWEVTQNGNPAGRNRIERIHGGCALSENWQSARGNFTGSSLNIYDHANNIWHQTWVDTTGTLLKLDGGFSQGRMVLQGKRPDADGNNVIHRISWTPNADSSVRQHWETSTDGETWVTAFDGLYVKTENSE